jgi:hypothetical protein
MTDGEDFNISSDAKSSFLQGVLKKKVTGEIA